MSAFQGWLLKFGNTILPNKFAAYSDYTCTPNQRTELDAYRNLNNLLRRDTSENYKTKIEFNTHPMYLPDKIEMQEVFNDGLLVEKERKYKVTYWNDEENTYKTGEFYMPDIDYKIINVDEENKMILYDKIRIALIEY